jgi:3'-phosphoadenosine 5'-phosphosulfate (PAPS) 3'-phosphatase
MIIGKSLVNSLIELTLSCGSIAIEGRSLPGFTVSKKNDGSIVSNVDIEINDYILRFIHQNFDNYGIVSEESPIFNHESKLQFFIDPIDGTRSYCAGSDEFTINISIFYESSPIFSVIYAPLYRNGLLGYSDENNNLVIKSKEFSLHQNNPHLNIISSRNNNNEFFHNFLQKSFYSKKNCFNIKKVSSSVKFLDVLSGGSDLFILPHCSYEWDVAAGYHLVNISGGFAFEILDASISEIRSLSFFKKDFLNKYLIFASRYGKETCSEL